MIKIASVQEMRAIERAADASGVTYADMMEHAGHAVVEAVADLLGPFSEGQQVVVLVGPGNNGGDGLVAARVLKRETQAEVSCYLLKPRGDDDANFVAAREAGVFIADAESDQRWRVLKNLVTDADIVVDGLLGTGARLPIEGDAAKLLQHAGAAIKERRSLAQAEDAHLIMPGEPAVRMPIMSKVVAIDCPSGLDCDSGALDPAAIPADVTVTFGAAKLGQVRFPGAEAIGRLIVAGIGLPPDLDELAAVGPWLVSADEVRKLLPPRPRDGHKGTFGRLVAVTGSVNYTGAAGLAGLGAYRVGTGLVTMAVPQPIYPVLAARLPEATWLLLPHEMGVINSAALEVFYKEVGQADALLLGPGWGREEETGEFLRGLLRADHRAKKGHLGFLEPGTEEDGGTILPSVDLPPLVIDADGLNLLAEIEAWPALLPEGSILTPHPGEMARLTGLSREAIQADRLSCAAEYAAKWKAVVVLKGAHTVVASPVGGVAVMPFASSALATAGTGDVLAGAIAGLRAQGLDPFEAGVAGAYLHGLAGQLAALRAGDEASVIAGDVADALGVALQRVRAQPWTAPRA
jgi:hydroxyethylthiazole kinase-like uncharacterized protein yjeF